MRLFIGIPIPKSNKREINLAASELKTQNLPLKWETSEKWHLTLKFLGKTDKNRIEEVIFEIEKITKKTSSFYLQPAKLGCFPKKTFILWLSLTGQINYLAALSKSLEKNLTSLGFPKEKHLLFPHITLARSKKISRSQAQNIKKSLLKLKLPCLNPFKVEKVILYQSTLTPQGSTYQIVKTFPLS